MTAATLPQPTEASVEALLREQLARGDAGLSAAAPTLRHLLADEDHALLSQEVVARVRGMLTHLARQLLHAQADAGGLADRASFLAGREREMAEALVDDLTLLAHVHALATEGSLALQLQARCAIDPVLCPLLEDLVASRDDGLAGAAMAALAAQARFIQHHRRMALPLGELPGDLFEAALRVLRANAGEHQDAAALAERGLRGSFDEKGGRLALLARLVMRTGTAALPVLDVEQAGLSIFANALALAAGQGRDVTVLSLRDRRAARLALALRAAGLSQRAIERQLVFLCPDAAVPNGFDKLSAERASALLASGPSQ